MAVGAAVLATAALTAAVGHGLTPGAGGRAGPPDPGWTPGPAPALVVVGGTTTDPDCPGPSLTTQDVGAAAPIAVRTRNTVTTDG